MVGAPHTQPPLFFVPLSEHAGHCPHSPGSIDFCGKAIHLELSVCTGEDHGRDQWKSFPHFRCSAVHAGGQAEWSVSWYSQTRPFMFNGLACDVPFSWSVFRGC